MQAINGRGMNERNRYLNPNTTKAMIKLEKVPRKYLTDNPLLINGTEIRYNQKSSK